MRAGSAALRSTFAKWLASNLQVTRSRLAEARRLEAHYGDLDRLYDGDRFAALLQELAYSKDDERNDRPNPARFPIAGVTYNSLNTYRATLRYYARFRAEEDRMSGGASSRSGPWRRLWQRLRGASTLR